MMKYQKNFDRALKQVYTLLGQNDFGNHLSYEPKNVEIEFISSKQKDEDLSQNTKKKNESQIKKSSFLYKTPKAQNSNFQLDKKTSHSKKNLSLSNIHRTTNSHTFQQNSQLERQFIKFCKLQSFKKTKLHRYFQRWVQRISYHSTCQQDPKSPPCKYSRNFEVSKQSNLYSPKLSFSSFHYNSSQDNLAYSCKNLELHRIEISAKEKALDILEDISYSECDDNHRNCQNEVFSKLNNNEIFDFSSDKTDQNYSGFKSALQNISTDIIDDIFSEPEIPIGKTDSFLNNIFFSWYFYIKCHSIIRKAIDSSLSNALKPAPLNNSEVSSDLSDTIISPTLHNCSPFKEKSNSLSDDFECNQIGNSSDTIDIHASLDDIPDPESNLTRPSESQIEEFNITPKNEKSNENSFGRTQPIVIQLVESISSGDENEEEDDMINEDSSDECFEEEELDDEYLKQEEIERKKKEHQNILISFIKEFFLSSQFEVIKNAKRSKSSFENVTIGDELKQNKPDILQPESIDLIIDILNEFLRNESIEKYTYDSFISYVTSFIENAKFPSTPIISINIHEKSKEILNSTIGCEIYQIADTILSSTMCSILF